MDYNAAILRNKGVQVEVAVLGEDGQPITTADGDPKTEQKWVRFDSNCIADLEEIYGNLTEFEQASRVTPFKAVRQGLAVAWDTDTKTAGKMMLDGKIGDYSTAVGVALALANGVDPTQAGRLLKVGVKASTRQMTERDKMLAEQIAEAEKEEAEASATANGDDENESGPENEPLNDSAPETAASPGTSGSKPGSPPDTNTTPSGG